MAGNIEEMLINLESPEKNSNVIIHNHYLKNPLIPGPDLNCNELESNNPFDVVAQSAENWDPFELVLNQSLMHYGRNHSFVENNDKLVDSEFSIDRDNNCRLNRSNSVTNNIRFFPTVDKRYDNSDVDILNISSRSLDNSPSLRDKIKRVVKKRVSKCIEKALNGNTPQTDTSKQEVLPQKMCTYKIMSSVDNLRNSVPKLKKDESEDYSLKNFLEEAKQLSVILHNMSINEETQIFPIKRRTLSPSKESKILSELKVSIQEDDIMSIKPPWDGIDNDSSDSDDSSIGLPKVKLFYVKKKEKERKNELNQEKLDHYKKRIRASIDGNMFCEEDANSEEFSKNIQSHELKSDTQQLLEQQCDVQKIETAYEEPKGKEPLELLVVNKPIVPVTNDLRLKKVGKILKKGPMKAIVPLQKMTKSIAEKISPLKKNSPSIRAKGRNNDDSTLSSSLIRPVATSTPNCKNSLNDKTKATLLNPKSRPRLSRKDNEKTGNSRRSASLCTETRKSTMSKQPFSSINPNANQMLKRPHTAPSPNMNLKSSPQFKKNVDKGYVKSWVRSARPALSLGVLSVPPKNSQQQFHFI